MTNAKRPQSSVFRENIADGYGTEREVGAYEVAKLVKMADMVAPCVIRVIDGTRGSVAAVMPGVVAACAENPYGSDEILGRAAAFDYVIGNEDRHLGNWLVDADKLHLVDHSLVFPDLGDYGGLGYHAFLSEAVRRLDNTRFSPIYFATSYLSARAHIEAALKQLQFLDGAIEGVAKRIEYLHRAPTWRGLPGVH